MFGIEIFIVILLVASLLWGYKKGIIVQMGSLVSFFVALATCRILGGVVSDAIFTAVHGDNPAYSSMDMFMAKCFGHIFVFVATWVVVWLMARTMKFFAKAIHIGFIDRITGALFMGLKTGMIVSLIINFAKTVAPESALAASKGPVSGVVSEIAPFILGFVQQSVS